MNSMVTTNISCIIRLFIVFTLYSMRHSKKHLIVDAMFKERNMFPYNIHRVF